MLNWELQSLRLLKEEIDRLERIGKKMEKSRKSKKNKAYYANLEQCRKTRSLLLSEKLLEKVPLSKAERAMAESFYYHGKKWEDAVWDAIDTLSPTKQELFDTGDDDKDDKNREQYIGRLKKSIERKIKSTFIDIEDKEN